MASRVLAIADFVVFLTAILMPCAAASGENLATFPVGAESFPAARYAALRAPACKAELSRRGVSFRDVGGQAPGVLAPVRLSGPVNGVTYHTALPEAARATSPWEVFDCRLVLSLFDFGGVLRAHEIDDVVMFSAWRPPPKKWRAGKIADRHPGGLAIDIQKLHQKSGTWLVVEDDYHGHIGSETCGENSAAPDPPSDGAKALRALVCEAVEAHLFQVVLTPNYNRAHFNHVHLEVKAGVKWFLAR
jgi:Extensin-like protein C-terminus